MIREKTGLSEKDVTERVGALIITRGERGSTISAQGETFNVPVVPTDRVVDPTGVGDAYRAGLVKGLALRAPLQIAGRIGSVAAAYVLEKKGTQNHCYTQSEFVARFRQHFDDSGLLNVMADE
jgi:adenosine kinase